MYNKKEFLRELRRETQLLPFDEQEELVSYYEEYIEEAGMSELKSPKDIAKTALEDYAISDKPINTPKEGINKVWIIILAIFAAPFLLPFVLPLLVLVVVVLPILALSVIIAIGLPAIVFLGLGIGIFLLSFPLLFTDLLTGVYFMGMGIGMTGVGVIFTLAAWFVIKKTIILCIRFISFILSKTVRRIKGRKNA